MPELPEVETLRRELTTVLVGQTIKQLEVGWLKMIRPFTARTLNRQIAGHKISALERSAKILIFALSSGDHLLIHLKMTGQLIYRPVGQQEMVVGGHPQRGGLVNLPNKYTRLIIRFTSGDSLFFNDLRKFGWLKVVGAKELESLRVKTGLEPLQPTFTLAAFSDILKHYPKRKIKQLLLDQSLIAGLGNIYADESCFAAKILPTRVVKNLTNKETKLLHWAIIKILRASIAKKGTSAKNYLRSDGTPGGFVPYLKVYGRAGKKCKRCERGVIHKIKFNGRGTHFCPTCQK